ncbi:MAG: aminoacyl-tRNA hydrolase [Acidimicrobiia bacterium]|nr:aminoacyl-tRNA hydrolase [Acidimicrobiia bacterium]
MQVTRTIAVDDRHIEERFVRAPGPGGQNVNKVASAVELRFDAAASGLPDDVRGRLTALAGTRMTGDGVLVLHCHEHRTQKQNREAARERLLDLLRRAARKPRARRPTRPPAAAREERLDAKKRRSALKVRRGPVADD